MYPFTQCKAFILPLTPLSYFSCNQSILSTYCIFIVSLYLQYPSKDIIFIYKQISIYYSPSTLFTNGNTLHTNMLLAFFCFTLYSEAIPYQHIHSFNGYIILHYIWLNSSPLMGITGCSQFFAFTKMLYSYAISLMWEVHLQSQFPDRNHWVRKYMHLQVF